MEHLYSGGFVCADSLTWEATPGLLLLVGEIACKGNIVISVEKILAVDSDESGLGALDVMVWTVRYAYNASVRGHGNILRHDNAHPHPGHPDNHHRHEFNWRTDEELDGFPRWCGAEGWPTLGDFVQEIEEWYWAHRAELPDPEAVPELGLR